MKAKYSTSADVLTLETTDAQTKRPIKIKVNDGLKFLITTIKSMPRKTQIKMWVAFAGGKQKKS